MSVCVCVCVLSPLIAIQIYNMYIWYYLLWLFCQPSLLSYILHITNHNVMRHICQYSTYSYLEHGPLCGTCTWSTNVSENPRTMRKACVTVHWNRRLHVVCLVPFTHSERALTGTALYRACINVKYITI